MDSKKILEKAREYRDYTAQNLSRIIQVPAFSTTEKDRIALLKSSARKRAWKTSGSTASLAPGRVGSGSRKIVFDAHIDTVTVGDESQWKISLLGAHKRRLVYGRARPTSWAEPLR
jgi:acetylornithine deacetylase/succinyl-diaminopimelate desuccinylase-like protein